jgi:hypothetical protein
MSWYDTNRKEDSVAMGRKMAFMICLTWAFFWLGAWVAVAILWHYPGHEVRADGTEHDRNVYAFFLAMFGIVPAFLITWLRAGRDLYKQNEEAHQAVAQQRAAVAAQKTAHLKPDLSPQRRAGFNGLTIGSSTGFLYNRSHVAGIPNGQRLHLSPEDVCKNIWIGGGIGGGKTTRMINPLLQQVLAQDCSALVFDIKGDFRNELEYIAGQVQRGYQVVGDGGLTLNLFRGCTPEVAASYLKSCFIAGGHAAGDGAFWADTATNYCRNLLNLIRLSDGDYSIAGLADLVFSEARRLDAMKAAREREQSGQMDAREARQWTAVLSYMVDTVAKWEDKFRGNVQGTCEAVLNPFINPDLVDAFSVESDNGEADLLDLLNKPTIFLVNLPRYKFGAQGARFAYLLIKLRFFTMMAERRSRADVNQDRYVAFLCDEYQGIVDNISDTDFWDKSRSSKCFGIVSMQGYSSLVKAVGDQKAADAIMQNWRQRITFRTEDVATTDMVGRLLGQVDVHIESSSQNYSQSESISYGSEGPNRSTSTSNSDGVSVGIQRQGLFDANDFRKLDAQFCLFIGNVGDKAKDDVIEVAPLFIPQPQTVTA